MRLANKITVITGAASGIGRALAIALARRGCHLALVDRDAAGLRETRSALTGMRTSLHRLDVTDREAVAALPQAVLSAQGGVDLLINNAGVALGGRFADISEEDFDWLFAVNFHAPVRLTRAFLPLLAERPQARIVNISSVYGLIAPPGQSAYAASKFALRGFSQALGHELAGTGIGVTTVHPGGVLTRIADSARAPASASEADIAAFRAAANALLRMPPERAGEIIARGIERDRRRILVGVDAKLVALIERIAPVSYWRILARLRRGRART